MPVQHKTKIIGANNAGSQISANPWNDDHLITSLPLDPLTADPASPANGEAWYRDDLGQLRYRLKGKTGTIPAPGEDASITTDTTVCAADNGKTFRAQNALSLTLPTAPEDGFTIAVTAPNSGVVALVPGVISVEGGNTVWPATGVTLTYSGASWRRRTFRGFGFGQIAAIGILPDAADPATPSGLWQITAATANTSFLPALLTGYPVMCWIDRLGTATTTQTYWDPSPVGSGSWARSYDGAWSALISAGMLASLATASLPTGVQPGSQAYDTTRARIVTYDGTVWRVQASTVDLAALMLDGSAITTGTIPVAREPAYTGDVTSAAGSSVNTIAAGAVTLSKMAALAASTILGNNTGSAATPIALTPAQVKALLAVSLSTDVTGTLQAAQAPAHTGDVTSSAGSLALSLATVNANVGAFGSATQVATFTVDGKGRTTAAGNATISVPATAISDSTAAGRALVTAATATAQTALLDVVTSAAKGLAPASGGGTANFLRADGTWAAPAGGGGVTDGDKGDVIVSGSGAVWSLDYTAVNAVIAPPFANLTGRPASPFIKPGTGEFVSTCQFGNTAAAGIVAGAANSLDLFPFTPPFDVVSTGLSLRFNAGTAGGTAKFVVYEGAADFRPGTKIFEGADQAVTAAVNIADTFAWTYLASKTYWFGIRQNIVGLSPNAWTLAATPDLYVIGFSTTLRKTLRRTLTYATAAPSTWNWLTADSSANAAPAIMIVV